ncbi:hypothetical protein BT67DRAFT_158740 [Trichocladium antarcticum]|uniref:Uncharacterized protein n=1 Tax=Trichocladium antarcticum TaxID=1450529 RepID=A0AAN6ZB02_9PEZI|nr:hypothetical protein BT67DRAFT_158740 [Trichocladium antarcticum]
MSSIRLFFFFPFSPFFLLSLGRGFVLGSGHVRASGQASGQDGAGRAGQGRARQGVYIKALLFVVGFSSFSFCLLYIHLFTHPSVRPSIWRRGEHYGFFFLLGKGGGVVCFVRLGFG